MPVRLVRELTVDEAKQLAKSRDYSFKRVASWSGFDAFGEYYVDIEKKLCLYVHFNERAGTDNSALYEFDDVNELANWIWEEQKGTIPFREIREGFKRAFGVDVKMNIATHFIRLLFGEAGE